MAINKTPPVSNTSQRIVQEDAKNNTPSANGFAAHVEQASEQLKSIFKADPGISDRESQSFSPSAMIHETTAAASVEQRARAETLLGGFSYHLADQGKAGELNVRQVAQAITGQTYPETKEGVRQAADDFIALMKGRENI